MRLRFCQLDDVTVRTNDGFGRCFGRGAHVDFDEVLGTDAHGHDVTVEAALGEHAASFTALEVVAPVLPSPVLDIPEDGHNTQEGN
jgi:hypothetical protein